MIKSLLSVVGCGAMAILAGEAFCGDWHVKADAEKGGDGSSAAPFTTIQQAVDAASAEDTIFVQPGVYDQGSTNAWRVNRTVPFDQQTRVYVTKKLTIVSTSGREVTIVKGSQGTVSDDETGKNMAYRTNGVQCMVIGAAAAGTVVRGLTFEDGTAHQSAAPGNIAAGGLCAATPSSANDFLVTDSAFVRCFGRGGGGLHGGTAIRCLFEKCDTNTRGSSANESRLYNCISRDASYGNIGAAWDFCDCIAINCTAFNGFSRAGFCLSGNPRFGGTHYNSVSFGNYFTSTWSQLASYSRGTSINSLSDDRYESNTPAAIDDTDASQLSSICLSPWTNDFRPVKGGLLDGKGVRTYLTDVDDFVIPADEVNKDFFGNDIATDGPIPIGAILPAAEPKTGVLKLVAQLSVNGIDMATALAIVQSDKYPAEVRIGQSARMKTINAQMPLMALQKDGVVRYFGQYDDIVQLMPKPGAEIAWDVWTTESELYVGGEGADDDNAGTSDKPLATIQKAVGKVSNRTIIHVRPGRYGVQNGTYGNEPGDMDSDSVNSGLRSSVNVPSGKKVLIKSTDGASVTFIEGAPDPDTKGCGPKATRCVAVNANANAAFSGFTFCNGYAYNNDFQTDADKSYSAAFACGGANYQHVYDSVFTGNHGRGVVNKGQYMRCLFTNNADIASCVVYASTLSACIFSNNGEAGTAYILYNNVNAYNCSLYEPTFDGSLQNKNGHAVNSAYATSSGNMLNFDGNSRVIGSVVKAKSQPAQSYPVAMKYADPYFHAPGTADLRLQRPSEAVGYGVTSDPYGKVADSDFMKYMHGDYLNLPLVHEDGSVNAGAFSESLAEGMSDVYVDAVNGDDDNGGRSETTAKKTLQAAMSVRIPLNAKIVALPGHYKEGSALHVGNSFKSTSKSHPEPTVKSRVVVPEGYTLVSRDGAATTFIEGEPDAESQDPKKLGRGPGAMRCVFLEKNATIRGFTITNGHTDYYESGDDDQYVDDFYGAGVFARAATADGNGALAGTRVENCIIVSNYGDLGGAGGITSFYNCFVTNNWGVSYGGFFRHGACYNCYVDDCHGARMCDVLVDCVNCTFGVGNADVNGSVTYPFANIKSAARVWNFLLLSSAPDGFKLGKNVKNIVIGSELKPAYDGTPENVHDELLLEELRSLYNGGKAKGKDAPSVDTGCSEALALLSEGDVEQHSRVVNGAIDIGAFEYDWRSDYGSALGRHITVTDEKGVVEAGGVVTLADGASLTANWTGRRGLETDYQIRTTVTGGGCLEVFLNGEFLGKMTASGILDFSNAVEVNALRFAYTGQGVATVLEMRRVIGTSITLR